MKCLVVVLAIFAIARSQDCKCPKGYHPEEQTNWCRMDKDYIDCNAPPQPACRCPQNFEPNAYSLKNRLAYQCVDSKNTKQSCINADEVQTYINKYLTMSSYNNNYYGYCNCPEGMSHSSEDVGRHSKYHYCLNTRLPFRRIPCNLPLPPTCECSAGSKVTQFNRRDNNLKCQHLILKLQCTNDDDRSAYYGQVMDSGCENNCNIVGN